MLSSRVRAFMDGAPLFFVGAVLAIAVVFRLGLGLMKPPAATEPEAPTFAVSHTPVPAATTATPAAFTEPVVVDEAPKPIPAPKKKPRTHGKR